MGHFYNKLDESDKALVDKAVKFHNEVCEDPDPNLPKQAFSVFMDKPALKSEALAFLLITMRDYAEPKLRLCISDSADLKDRIATLTELSTGDRVKSHVQMMQGVINDAFYTLVPDSASKSIEGLQRTNGRLPKAGDKGIGSGGPVGRGGWGIGSD